MQNIFLIPQAFAHHDGMAGMEMPSPVENIAPPPSGSTGSNPPFILVVAVLLAICLVGYAKSKKK